MIAGEDVLARESELISTAEARAADGGDFWHRQLLDARKVRLDAL